MAIVAKRERAPKCAEHREALTMLANGKVRDAVLKLASLTEKEPFNAQLCVDMGKGLLLLGMNDQAIIAARHAIELDSMNVEAFSLLASALDNQGEYAQAEQALRRALDICINGEAPLPDLEKEPMPIPLTASDCAAIFMDFSLLGDCENLALRSIDSGKEYRLTLRVRGVLPTDGDEKWTLVREGTYERSRVISALDEKTATAVQLFPAEQFPYILEKKG